MKMSSLVLPSNHTNNYRAIRVITIVLALLLSQTLFGESKAQASVFTSTYIIVSEGIAFDLGNKACGYLCAAAAVSAVAVVNTQAPKVATKAVEYAKPGLFEMLTNWGLTFLRP